MVEEEQLPVRLQLPAGNEDTTDVTGLDTDENGPNTVTNVIVGTFSSSLVASPATTGRWAYSFLPVLDGTQVLKTDGGNLTSQGANVLFALSGGMLNQRRYVGTWGMRRPVSMFERHRRQCPGLHRMRGLPRAMPAGRAGYVAYCRKHAAAVRDHRQCTGPEQWNPAEVHLRLDCCSVIANFTFKG